VRLDTDGANDPLRSIGQRGQIQQNIGFAQCGPRCAGLVVEDEVLLDAHLAIRAEQQRADVASCRAGHSYSKVLTGQGGVLPLGEWPRQRKGISCGTASIGVRACIPSPIACNFQLPDSRKTLAITIPVKAPPPPRVYRTCSLLLV